MAAAHKSDIKIAIELDENRVPEKMAWTARDGGVANEEAKAMLLSLWDHKVFPSDISRDDRFFSSCY